MKSTQLQGHRKSISCIQPVTINVVSTCSEDQTIRLWDIRERRAAVKCIITPGIEIDCLKTTPGNENEWLIFGLSSETIFTFGNTCIVL